MLTLPLPPALNRLYRTGRGSFYKSEEAKLYEQEISLRLRHLRPLTGRVRLEIVCYFQRTTNDIDSRLKALLDVLQGSVYENDRQVEELLVIKKIDKENPRVEIEYGELAA